MTEQEINIAIAEACGWKKVIREGSGHAGYEDDLWGDKPGVAVRCPIPDYCHDLNAMHEAEKMLSPYQQDDYWNELAGLLHQPQMVHASARQRAEAFLRVKGLWKQ
jgi:hypothetical protein